MRNSIINCLFFLLFLPLPGKAQVPMTLKNAIDSALLNNFDIRIAKNSFEIARINNSYGNAGGLPSINATAGDNKSLYNLKQKTSSGLDITKDNVKSNSYNASVTAGITLFNGFRIIATKKQLNLLQNQSELMLNQQVQNTMASVMVNYYDILRQQSYLNIIKSSLDLSSRKYDIIKERMKVGMANDADLLQAQMDLNQSRQNLIDQQVIIEQDKTGLLQLIGVKKFIDIAINDTILVDRGLQRDTVINFLDHNPQYLSAEQQVMINEQLVREIRAQRYPSIRLSGGYNFTYSSSAAGFNLFTQNIGPTVGATLQVPVFNGTIYKTQQDAARINVNTAKLQKESLLNSLKADAIKTFQSYKSNLEQLESQRKNYEDAGRLVDIVLQRFRLNESTILDVKAAQNSFESAGYTYVNLLYAAKIAEIELKRLIYQLSY